MGGRAKQREITMRGLTALVLLAALPTLAGAQDARLERVRQAFPSQAAEIESLLSTAEAAGVPTDPLIAKALEGAAKGVPGDRVVAALSDYATRLGAARNLVGAERDPTTLVAGADALRRGVPPETVGSLAAQHQGELVIPLMVLGELCQLYVPVDHAYAVVESALSKQHGPDELLAIPGAVRRMMREGQSPAEAAHTVGNAIGHGKFGEVIGPPGQLEVKPGKGPPVPPGSGPPDHAGPKKDKGKGKPPGN